LGLNISKRLTELMNGRIWFESKENEGSSFYFTVTVPIHSNDVDHPSEAILIDQLKSFLNFSLKILIAEDNTMNQVVVSKTLKQLGFDQIDIAENGKVAVTKAKETKFDIILMDCMMPIVSGKNHP
jgi:PleD family two-component response regulator